MTADPYFYLLKEFFDRPICQKAAMPLKDGCKVTIQVERGGSFTLLKNEGLLSLEATASSDPDISFFLGSEIPFLLNQISSNDIGETGVSIFNWMLEKNPARRISVKVYLESFSVIRKGYLGVLAQGGIPLMQFLATKGLGNFSKIKNALSNLRR